MVGRGHGDNSGALAVALAFHGMTQLSCLCFPGDPGDRPLNSHVSSTYCVPGTALEEAPSHAGSPGRKRVTSFIQQMVTELPLQCEDYSRHHGSAGKNHKR